MYGRDLLIYVAATEVGVHIVNMRQIVLPDLRDRVLCIPSVALGHPVRDVAGQVRKQTAPEIALVYFSLLRILVHAQFERNMKVGIREPNTNHFRSSWVTAGRSWYREFVHAVLERIVEVRGS